MSDESTEATEYTDADAEGLLADAVSADTGEGGSEKQKDDKPSYEDLVAERDKYKALSRKHEQTAKANSSAAKRLQEIEDEKKSTEEKLTEQLNEAQVKLTEYQVAQTRREAAEAAGLPQSLAKWIRATDPDEALEQAKELAQLKSELGEEEKPAQPDLKQGVRQTAKRPPSIDDWLRNAVGN